MSIATIGRERRASGAERYYIHRCGEADAFALTAQTSRDCVKRRRRIDQDRRPIVAHVLPHLPMLPAERGCGRGGVTIARSAVHSRGQ